MGSKSGFSEPSPTQEHLTVAQVLRAAADLIEREGAWTKGELARSASGHLIGPRAPEAVCWCGVGAVERAANGNSLAFNNALNALERVAGSIIPPWNDAPERTQPEVVAALRKAADLAEAGVGRLGNQDNATTGQGVGE